MRVGSGPTRGCRTAASRRVHRVRADRGGGAGITARSSGSRADRHRAAYVWEQHRTSGFGSAREGIIYHHVCSVRPQLRVVMCEYSQQVGCTDQYSRVAVACRVARVIWAVLYVVWSWAWAPLRRSLAAFCRGTRGSTALQPKSFRRKRFFR